MLLSEEIHHLPSWATHIAPSSATCHGLSCTVRESTAQLIGTCTVVMTVPRKEGNEKLVVFISLEAT